MYGLGFVRRLIGKAGGGLSFGAVQHVVQIRHRYFIRRLRSERGMVK